MSNLSWEAWFTLAVVAATLFLLVREVASPDLIMLGSLAVLLLAGVYEEPASAFVGFSSQSVLAVGALFVVAAAARKTGAVSFAFRWIRPRSTSVPRALARFMLPVSAISAFVNNAPLVALLAPAVQEWAIRARIAPSKLLIPLSYATILGGTATLIGTSTNVVVSDALSKVTGEGLSMFELAWVGVPASLLGFVYVATIGHRLLPERAESAALAGRDVRSYQFELRVSEGSPLAGQTVEAAGLRHLEGAFLAHVVRKRDLIAPVRPNLILESGDLLAFSGSRRIMDSLLAIDGLERVMEPLGVDASERAHAPDLPLFEAVVSEESSLVGKNLQQARFRERFQAVVLGIHRKGRRVDGPLGRSPLESGDLLLIESCDDFAARWLGSDEFYFVARLERAETAPSKRAPWVLAIMVATVLVLSFGWLPLASAALVAALAVVFVAGLSPTEARQAVDLSVLLVLAGGYGLGAAIDETGLAQVLGRQLVEAAAGFGALGVLAGVYVVTNALTECLTNNVAAIMVFPIGLAAAKAGGVDPRAVAVVIAIAASAGFATPVGYQTNLMVMGPGGYRFTDYVKVGVPLNLLVMALTLCVVYWVWL